MSLRDSHSACGKTDSRGVSRGPDGVWREESQSRSDMSYGPVPSGTPWKGQPGGGVVDSSRWQSRRVGAAKNSKNAKRVFPLLRFLSFLRPSRQSGFTPLLRNLARPFARQRARRKRASRQTDRSQSCSQHWGEAPAEPLVPSHTLPRSRLRRSVALPLVRVTPASGSLPSWASPLADRRYPPALRLGRRSVPGGLSSTPGRLPRRGRVPLGPR